MWFKFVLSVPKSQFHNNAWEIWMDTYLVIQSNITTSRKVLDTIQTSLVWSDLKLVGPKKKWQGAARWGRLWVQGEVAHHWKGLCPTVGICRLRCWCVVKELYYKYSKYITYISLNKNINKNSNSVILNNRDKQYSQLELGT